MTVFKIVPFGQQDDYAVRLRSLVSAALEIAIYADFEADPIDVSPLPSWFVRELKKGNHADREALLGRDRYLQCRSNEPVWGVQEWISCFDPRLRRWEWWDLTQENRSVSLWVNTKSELAVPVEELWWAMFISGARGIEGPFMRSDSEWRARQSIP
ncbi:hypothetical protein [Actinomadura sp. HBU206391]|uniref:hypothetical protein n=1 Tax=Actinomadura sp. HBU206391 TaxID=2731692 RepID=UPI00164FEE86|nr:hypothetical protein [Actinomadura sp. HBU206391]MBC6463716.1 hypothetical protein [Actinomadura sp. HBU206391]